ncbi:MAG: hypothetical protein FD122_2110 [Stygiobacter sp.]|nr:MAG: hypothetical protein FD122_2110 [Stygiobacter sp.]KAF0215387.1 MAG: hypothetical protein FD178_1756 [Ignavibacteria bacterium]
MEETLKNIIEINEQELIWLKEAYNHFLNDLIVARRIIKIKLLNILSPSFDPLKINSLLLKNGSEITLAGILFIEPDSPFLIKCDKYINYIKNAILKNSSINEITYKDISDEISIPVNDFTKIINKLSELGNFTNGSSTQENNIVRITIGSDEVYDEYLNYSDINSLIIKKVKTRLNYLIDGAISRLDMPDIRYNPMFRSSVKQIDKNLCFVLMPFSEEWSERVYFKLIRPIVEGMKLQCIRADNLSGPIIIEDIWIKINQCAFIIADVTNKNPNVMYELGIVHTLGKPAILITQDISQIPFDFSHLRHYEYKDNTDGFEKLSKELPVRIREMYFDFYKTNI